ncbi:beta-ketoacyl-[acyl-carrier-protein] synthase family protein [Burkholderia pyrrocinia]|uniref:beta-ketoacyl-[acyl-carrier-protein] synthase family protein n=1 Tax=Burkholderia TaxID=32008 RepID=UPI001588FEAE|nr:beta-ketoacyl-[acyl-carrier-protein] synthase family protein [Burkholderia cenocepacia]EKS9886950.1 beta-ketoacyl-[acyl-carrier-protein] synthase family protein [Burkholderia pyrrocinia]EKS9895905.1 beta-ketoacyl-[acyl-carrier-protein] synthase family protein [Burkholderia pyrrocinia]EKS9908578.1 beta-ketoacyl-[acyl-carrier-protein] synthase family protein [Burkholderia pyrrocinia]
MKRDVVITGIGLAAPLGIEPTSFFDALVSGKNGIRRHPDPTIERHVGYVDLDIGAHFSIAESRNLDRVSLLALYAARQAVANSGLRDEAAWRNCGVFVGTGIGGVGSLAEGIAQYHGIGRRSILLTVPAAMPHAPAAHLAMSLGTSAEAITYSTACSAGAVAIGEAFRRIRDGYSDIAVCGGTEAMLTPPLLEAWDQLRVLCAEPADAPATGCRPFSGSRSGFALSEGACMVVLEPRDHAIARGATPIAELVGYGTSNDHSHLTLPTPAGQALAIRRALDDARIDAKQVGYVNAHGTGTRNGDVSESDALRAVFERSLDNLPVSSTKSAHGHLIGAAGALELAICAMAVHEQRVPPTLHYDAGDRACGDIDYVPHVGRRVEGLEFAISNSFGMGGNNTVLAVKRC